VNVARTKDEDSGVGTPQPPYDHPLALRIIEDEHRSLGAVLGGLLAVLQQEQEQEQAPGGGPAPDPALLRAMIRYVRDFPERLHHPREDDHLFRALRARAPELAPVLDALEEEHSRGAALLAGLEGTLERALAGELPRAALAAAAREYADFEWAHMRKEEQLVLPVAVRRLDPADWAAIDAAFAAHADPLAGIDARLELRELFRRITALAPAPIGVGPARAGKGGRP
jgi:hemerythrin-like domain-containing protein